MTQKTGTQKTGIKTNSAKKIEKTLNGLENALNLLNSSMDEKTASNAGQIAKIAALLA